MGSRTYICRAASTRTGPADGQRIGVNACHSWGENLVLKTSNQVKHCHLEEFQLEIINAKK